MKKLRVLTLMHTDLVPPASVEGLSVEEFHPFRLEYDVSQALAELGHEVLPLGVDDELRPIRHALKEFRPHVVFNLLTHFHNEAVYDSAIVSWLELQKQPYTGCNPRGLLVASDKALCKKVLNYHRIQAPRFFTVPRSRSVSGLPKGLNYPVFVKSRSEHASQGIAQASIVRDDRQLAERVEFIHRKIKTAALCEEYVDGRELSIGVLGNRRLETAPVWEVFFDDLPDGAPKIFTSRVKWDTAYQERIGLRTAAAELPPETAAKIDRAARRIYRALGMSGYARVDLRMNAAGEVFVLEVNPNPDLSRGEDFAESFELNGYSYPDLVQKLLNLGVRYEAPWKG